MPAHDGRPAGDGQLGWRRRALALAGLCLAVYLLTGTGFVHNADGKLIYAVTRSVVTHGNFTVPAGMMQAVQARDGSSYSPYNLGLSLVAAPFYLVGNALTSLAPTVAGFTAADFVVSTVNAFITAATVWLMVRLVIELGYPLRAGLLTGAAYGFGTMAWHYSATLFSEPATALCLLLSVFLLVRSGHAAPVWPWVLGAGLAGGGALFVRVTAAVFAPGLFLYLVLLHRRSGRSGWQIVRLLALFGVGYALFAGATLWFNYVRFGSLTETGYTAYDPGLTQGVRGAARLHLSDVLYAFYGMLLSPGRGVFLYAPALFLALAGLPSFTRRHPLEATLAGLLSGALLLMHALLPFGYWFGAFSWGPRYLLSVVPVAVLPAAACFAGAAARPHGRLLVGLAMATMVILQLPSVAVTEQAHYTRVIGKEQWSETQLRSLVDSWALSPYLGQWREASRVTQRLVEGRAPPQARFGEVQIEMQNPAQAFEQAEALNTYRTWWLRLLWTDRLPHLARLAMLAVVGSLGLAAWLLLLICTGQPLPAGALVGRPGRPMAASATPGGARP